MTQEEKAKRYDEALERARKLQENSNGMILKKWLWNIFPELKESKDERVRKAILSGIKYLETELGWDAVGDIDILDAYAWLEKQGEQKSTDKAEPKFHEGDWVVSPDNLVLKITHANSRSYTLHLYNNDYCIFETERWYIDKKYHLWTIADARDGDILVCDINKAEIGGDTEKLPNITPTICIYMKTVKDQDFIHTYCSLYNRSSLVPYNAMYYKTFVYNIHPATKEQCNTLERAISNAGYRWDKEKLNFEKI